jgi:uncharacterized protein (TIGR02001 family)
MNTRKSALVALALLTSGAAQAEVSGNIGFASDYYFRGFFQKSSSASAGLDYEKSGFSAGVWAADVGGDVAADGIETDIYFGYGGEVGDFSYGIGYTGYFYTGDFDDPYQEINLSAGYGIVTLDAAIGKYDNAGAPLNYQFHSLTVEKNGLWGQYGTFEDELGGDYFQFGYNSTISELDFGISLLFPGEDIGGENNEALIFTIGKSFDL